MKTIKEGVRWSTFSMLGSAVHRPVFCAGCTKQIDEGLPGIAVYDDTRVDGSTVHTDYYHDACARCGDCGKVIFGDRPDHVLDCEARFVPRPEDGIAPGMFGGELRGAERDAFEDQVLAAAQTLVLAAEHRFDQVGWMEWRTAIETLTDLVGDVILAPLEYSLRVDVRKSKNETPRKDPGQEGHRVGYYQGLLHGFVEIIGNRRDRRGRTERRVTQGALPLTEWRGKPRREIGLNPVLMRERAATLRQRR